MQLNQPRPDVEARVFSKLYSRTVNEAGGRGSKDTVAFERRLADFRTQEMQKIISELSTTSVVTFRRT